MPQSIRLGSELVLPPLSPVLVGRPYAAVPHLAAYAEQRGGVGIRQLDLNQRYVDHVLRTARAPDLHRPGRVRDPADLAAAVDESVVAAVIEELRSTPGDPELLAAAARDPAIRGWLFEHAGLPADGNPEDLDAAFRMLPSLGEMREFFAAHYRRAGIPRLVGISVPFATQLAPALVLAEVVRELTDGAVFVVLGGPLPSLLTDPQVELLLRGSAVSGVVRHEGEEAFRRLHEAADLAPEVLASVPSLSHLDGERAVIKHPGEFLVRLTDTAPYRLDPQYVSEGVELPVIVGRGCFYTCAFCDYIKLYERINFRSAADVVLAARLATEQSSTGLLHFVYEVMSLKYERKLVRELVAADLGIQWRGFQRVYGEMTADDVRQLELSGCRRLDIGLESADDEALELMQKGYKRADIEAFLKAFLGTSIQLLINIIVDYPGLTHARALDSAQFLADATTEIDNVHFEVLRFALGRNSEMFDRPADFGLTLVSDTAASGHRPISPTQAAFETRQSMSESERARIEAFYRRLNTRISARRAERAAARVAASAEPWVGREAVVHAPAGQEDEIAVRRLTTSETFLVPRRYQPLIQAVRRQSAPSRLTDFLLRPDVADAEISRTECVDVLGAIGLLSDRAPQPQPRSRSRPVRVAMATDSDFFRGVKRTGNGRAV